MTDFRALCAELVEELAAETSLYPGHERGIVTRARDALAEPETEPPTDEDLWDIGERHLWTGTDESVTNDRILTSFIEAARAVLARWGK